MTEIIYIGIDDQKVKASGAVLEQILKDKGRAEAEELQKQTRLLARESALAKLAALGLTEAEIAAL